jgi:hypothetical protein
MYEEEVFKPNEKELKLFEKEKLELYKGTFVVCLVYGITAFLLLIVILFTKWGKEYIYDKFAPAIITYILGSIIIIVYLLSSIYSIKPRKIGKDIESDNNIICPEYWKLEKVPDDMKQEIIQNNNIGSKIIPEINSEQNTNIQYRCKYDKNVYGNTSDYLKMTNDISNTKYYPGFNTSNIANIYATNLKAKLTPDYIVSIPSKDNVQTFKELKKYAKFSGAYSLSNSNMLDDSNNRVLKVGDASYLSKPNMLTKYETDAPLICNVVYPQVLGILDSKTTAGNEVSCAYAKQCGISWSSLDCK